MNPPSSEPSTFFHVELNRRGKKDSGHPFLSLREKRRGCGPPGELEPHRHRELLQKLARGKTRRGTDIQRWLAERCGLRVTLTSISRYFGKMRGALEGGPPASSAKK